LRQRGGWTWTVLVASWGSSLPLPLSSSRLSAFPSSSDAVSCTLAPRGRVDPRTVLRTVVVVESTAGLVGLSGHPDLPPFWRRARSFAVSSSLVRRVHRVFDSVDHPDLFGLVRRGHWFEDPLVHMEIGQLLVDRLSCGELFRSSTLLVSWCLLLSLGDAVVSSVILAVRALLFCGRASGLSSLLPDIQAILSRGEVVGLLLLPWVCSVVCLRRDLVLG